MCKDGSFRDRNRLSILFRRATHKHRVELLTKKVWTFCIKVYAQREWGFWKAGEFIPWRDYIKSKGLEPISQ